MTKSTDKHDTIALSNELMKGTVQSIKANGKCVECCFMDMIVIMMVNLLAQRAQETGQQGVTLMDVVSLAAHLTTSCQATIEDGDLELHQVDLNKTTH